MAATWMRLLPFLLLLCAGGGALIYFGYMLAPDRLIFPMTSMDTDQLIILLSMAEGAWGVLVSFVVLLLAICNKKFSVAKNSTILLLLFSVSLVCVVHLVIMLVTSHIDKIPTTTGTTSVIVQSISAALLVLSFVAVQVVAVEMTFLPKKRKKSISTRQSVSFLQKQLSLAPQNQMKEIDSYFLNRKDHRFYGTCMKTKLDTPSKATDSSKSAINVVTAKEPPTWDPILKLSSQNKPKPKFHFFKKKNRKILRDKAPKRAAVPSEKPVCTISGEVDQCTDDSFDSIKIFQSKSPIRRHRGAIKRKSTKGPSKNKKDKAEADLQETLEDNGEMSEELRLASMNFASSYLHYSSTANRST